MSLNIGDRVRVRRTLRREVQENGAGDVRRVLLFDDADVEGIYLGWTTRQTGIIKPGYEYGGPTDLEPRYQEPYLSTDATYRVCVVQPVGKRGRWRRPVVALEEDVEAV